MKNEIEDIVYENKYCKIVFIDGGVYKTISKKGHYNDQYNLTLQDAKKQAEKFGEERFKKVFSLLISRLYEEKKVA